MELKEFNQKIRDAFFAECDNALLLGSNNSGAFQQVRVDYEMKRSYLSRLPGYNEWTYVPVASKSNIAQCFADCPGFGNKIGFIDLGMVFKKGKVGILFFEGGLSIRTLTEKQAFSIPYSVICASLITVNNTFLSDYKFTIQSGLIKTIESGPKIEPILQGIRQHLLKYNQDAKALFYKLYTEMLKQIKNSVLQNQNDIALSSFQTISAIIASNPDDGYTPLYKVKSLLEMLQEQFAQAEQTAKDAEDYEWLGFVSEKHKEFNTIQNQIHFNATLEADARSDCDTALKEIKLALEYVSTEECWNKYIDLILKYANSDNLFLLSDADFVLQYYSEGDIIKARVGRAREAEILVLKDKAMEWMNGLQKMMTESIIQRDMQFVRQKKEAFNYQDAYGMTPLMYAVACRNYEAFNLIYDVQTDRNLKNVLGFHYLDIAFLVCPSLSDYEAHYAKYSKWFCDAQAEFDKNRKSLERSKAVARFTENMGNAVVRKATSSRNIGRVDMNDVYNAARTADQMRDRRFEQEEELSQSERDFEDKKVSYFASQRHRVWEILYNYSSKTTIDIPLRTDESKIMSLADSPNYAKAFQKKKQSYIQEYINTHLTPKGEFETTAQFEQRKQQVEKDSEAEFMITAPAILMKMQDEYIRSSETENQKIELAKLLTIVMFSGKVKLEKYNADFEHFAISWNGFFMEEAGGLLAVPLSEAPDFKAIYADNGLDIKVNKTEFVFEDTYGNMPLLLAYCSINHNGKEYRLILQDLIMILEIPNPDAKSAKSENTYHASCPSCGETIQLDEKILQEKKFRCPHCDWDIKIVNNTLEIKYDDFDDDEAEYSFEYDEYDDDDSDETDDGDSDEYDDDDSDEYDADNNDKQFEKKAITELKSGNQIFPEPSSDELIDSEESVVEVTAVEEAPNQETAAFVNATEDTLVQETPCSAHTDTSVTDNSLTLKTEQQEVSPMEKDPDYDLPLNIISCEHCSQLMRVSNRQLNEGFHCKKCGGLIRLK